VEVPARRNTVIGLARMGSRMAQAIEQGNCGIARSRGKEAYLKPDEPTYRNAIQG
jgi:hypothetical protein